MQKKIIIWLLCSVLLVSGVGLLIAANFYLWVDEENSSIALEYDAEYVDDTPTAFLKGKLFCKEGYPLEVSTTGNVDTGKLGDYTLTYYTKFLFWEKEWTRTVTVRDTRAPIMTLRFIAGYYILPGHPYEEEGYSAYDACDGDLTDNVTSVEENGFVTYSVTDKSGNRTTIERKIHYDDPIPPELTLAGDETIVINAGQSYKEPGYTAIDNCDGDITENVKVEGSVDKYSAGEYKLIYTVQDHYKNTAKAERTVIVNAIRNPDTVNPGDKVIYLTFDDGPGPYTKDLLAVLDKYNVKATFFVVNSGYSDMIADEAAAGHSVGIHSVSHDYSKIYASKQAFFDDLLGMQKIIYNLTGINTTLMRFPGGSSNLVSKTYCNGIMTDLTKSVVDSGFQYFDWNVLSGDAGETTSTPVVVNNVIEGIKGKNVAVVLQHDIKKFSVDAVEDIILWGLNNGYTFLPLDMTSPAMHHGVQN